MWFVNRAGVGDEVAMTAVVREYRRCYPREEINVDSPRFEEIFKHNPHLLGGTEDIRPTVYLNQLWRPHELIGPMPVSYGLQAGITLHDTTPELWFTAAELYGGWEHLKGLPGGQPRVAIDVWAKWPSRRWAWANYAALASALMAQGWAVIELGRTDYDDFGEAATQRIPSTVCLYDKLGLRATAAVLARCDLYIGNDSGLMHMAAACGTPAVVFFGPKPWYSRAYRQTYPVYAPMRCPHTCDNRCTLAGHPCMAPITVAQALAAVAQAAACYKRVPPNIAKNGGGA